MAWLSCNSFVRLTLVLTLTVRVFMREHVKLGDQLEDFLYMHRKRLQLRVNLRVCLLKALCLLRMIQVADALLYEFCDVSDFRQDFCIRASINKALQILVNCIDVILVASVNIELIQFFYESGFLLIIFSRELKFELLFPFLKFLNNL